MILFWQGANEEKLKLKKCDLSCYLSSELWLQILDKLEN